MKKFKNFTAFETRLREIITGKESIYIIERHIISAIGDDFHISSFKHLGFEGIDLPTYDTTNDYDYEFSLYFEEVDGDKFTKDFTLTSTHPYKSFHYTSGVVHGWPNDIK